MQSEHVIFGLASAGMAGSAAGGAGGALRIGGGVELAIYGEPVLLSSLLGIRKPTRRVVIMT